MFSRSIGPLHCTVNINCRVLICCTFHFHSSSLFFVYFGFLCFQVSSVSNFCPDTRGQRWSLIYAHLFSCVVGERDTANKHHCHVWGMLTVHGPHWVCHSPRWCVLPGSTLVRLLHTLKGHCPKWARHFMHFPGLSRSGSRVLYKGTTQLGCVFYALLRSKQLR